MIEVPFRGRVLKIAGDRTFEPWTITIQNDSNFALRSAFEIWTSSIQAYNENFTSAAGLGDTDDATGYFADMTVHQLARDVKDGDIPKILKSYRFYNVFPSNIAFCFTCYKTNWTMRKIANVIDTKKLGLLEENYVGVRRSVNWALFQNNIASLHNCNE